MALLGGAKEVPANQNSVETDELARFAVDEHNKKAVTVSFSLEVLYVVSCGYLFCFTIVFVFLCIFVSIVYDCL